MGDTIFFVAFAGLLVGSWFLMPKGPARRLWKGLFGGVFLLVGAVELVALRSTGATLSQLFWRFSVAHRPAAWAILGALTAGWFLLLSHLAKAIVTRRHRPSGPSR